MLERGEIQNKLLKAIKFYGFDRFESIFESLTKEQRDVVLNNCRFLCCAIENGRSCVAHYLLDRRTRIDRLYKGTTPLHLSCEYGQVEIVKRLLESKINVNVKDAYGKTPLFYASDLIRIGKRLRKVGDSSDEKQISYILTRMLLENGSFVNIIGGNTSPLIIAIETQNIQVIKQLLKYKMHLNRRYKYGKQLVHYAAEHCDLNTFDLLIKNGLNINEMDYNNKTTLHYAASNGNIEIVNYLVNNKELINFTDRLLKTPLYTAVENNRMDVVEVLLVNGADVNIKDRFGWGPLHLSSRWKNEKIFDVLLKHSRVKGFDFNKCKNEINLEDKDCTGSNALHHAVYSGRLTIVEKLIELNAHVQAINNEGLTPLHIAVKSKLDDINIIKILLENGAFINATCNLGNTPLHYAVANLNVSQNTIDLLLEHGGDLMKVNNQKMSPLQIVFNLPQSNLFKRNSVLLHALKLSALNQPLDKNVKKLIDRQVIKKFPNFNHDCDKEIENMAILQKDKGVSIYKILTLPTNILINYLNNDDVYKYLNNGSYKFKFPIYSNLIKSRFEQATRRKENLERINDFFVSYTEHPLTTDSSEVILKYLNNKDLENIWKCLNMNNTDLCKNIN